MTPKSVRQPLSDAQLDAVLADPADSLYPSSGFTESVMSAIYRESPAPAPIPFPWRRAIPGFAAIAAALCLLAAVLIAMLRARPDVSVDLPLSSPIHPQLLTFLHAAPAADSLALLLSAGVTLGVLLLCRRLLSAD